MKAQPLEPENRRCVYFRDKVSYIYCRDKGYWNANGLFVEHTEGATGYRDQEVLRADAVDLVHSDFTNGHISIITFFSEAASYTSMVVEPVTVLSVKSKPGDSTCHRKTRM